MKFSKNVMRLLYFKEILFLALAVCSLLFLALDELGALSADQLSALYIYDVTVGCLFIAEFLFELRAAPDKKLYWKRNWFYLLAAIPLPLEVAQLLRGLRIIRIVKIIRFGIHYTYEQKKKRLT